MDYDMNGESERMSDESVMAYITTSTNWEREYLKGKIN
jgi:hypothetical protein